MQIPRYDGHLDLAQEPPIKSSRSVSEARPYNAWPWIKNGNSTVFAMGARATLLFFNITKTSPSTTSTVGSQTVARRHRSFRLADSRITVFYPWRSVVRPCHGNGTGTFYWRLLYKLFQLLKWRHSTIQDCPLVSGSTYTRINTLYSLLRIRLTCIIYSILLLIVSLFLTFPAQLLGCLHCSASGLRVELRHDGVSGMADQSTEHASDVAASKCDN